MRPAFWVRALCVLCVGSLSAPCETGWWMREPVRWVQTNLRETDAALDPQRLVDQLATMRANVLLMGMGGIAAYYPTTAEFHYPSPFLKPGDDLFGHVLRIAHAAPHPRRRPLRFQQDSQSRIRRSSRNGFSAKPTVPRPFITVFIPLASTAAITVTRP